MNPHVVIGNNIKTHYNTTIGTAFYGGKSPKIGDDVIIGANCVILGDITNGDNSTIGAGSVIITDVPPNAIVFGNPAKVLRYKNEKA